MAEKKVTTMILNVDLQCSKCYKKVKKLLCKFPEIRDQTYDQKANKVTIKVVCCSPEKIRDKLCCKGGGCIKSIEIKDDQKLVTIMVLDVNLQWSKCYKKVKKLLCKFHEIRDQEYDEKANKVTIKVVCCSPEKISDKLCCKGGGCIKSIEIKKKPVEPPKPPKLPPENPAEPPFAGTPEPLSYPPTAPPWPWAPEAEPGGPWAPSPIAGTPQPLSYPPTAPPWPWAPEAEPGGPIIFSVPPSDPPVTDERNYWGGGRYDYFSEENQQSCSIM